MNKSKHMDMNSQKSLLIRRRILLAALCASALPTVALAEDQDRKSSGSQYADERRVITTQEPAITSEQFAQKAALANLKEVRLGEIALQKSDDSDIKQFARQTMRDHAQADRRLHQIAQRKGLTMPPVDVGGQESGFTLDRRYERDPFPKQGSGAQRQMELLREYVTPEAEIGVVGRERVRVGEEASQGTQLKHPELSTIQRLQSLPGSEFDRAYAQEMVQDHAKVIQLFEQASQSLQDDELKRFATETLSTLREHHQMAQQLVREYGSKVDHSIQ